MQNEISMCFLFFKTCNIKLGAGWMPKNKNLIRSFLLVFCFCVFVFLSEEYFLAFFLFRI